MLVQNYFFNLLPFIFNNFIFGFFFCRLLHLYLLVHFFTFRLMALFAVGVLSLIGSLGVVLNIELFLALPQFRLQ